ncbi:MAG TPA: CoA pyrophosphatase [Candidatus Nitrosotenuis sp.]|jgi:8-oxo-dGTP pyrophosphatase MutT (NUDIX family)|nr:CoA pyrophosphatase [Candidatus Nitrosotenuis sp.]
MSTETLRKLLVSEITPHIDDTNTKHAAVLVVIYGPELKTIMIKKPMTMQLHAGEISFPGGKPAENDSDLLDTAIRETREEISLEVLRDQVIGQLKAVTTRNSGFTIIPFLAVIDDVSELRPNYDEVDEILHIPLVPLLRGLRLDDDPNHRALFEAYITTFENQIVWGASARILKQLHDIFKQNNLL